MVKYVTYLFVYLFCYFLFRKAIPTGMIAGAAGQFLASPTDLVKTRLQAEGKRILEGKKARYDHTNHREHDCFGGMCYLLH